MSLTTSNRNIQILILFNVALLIGCAFFLIRYFKNNQIVFVDSTKLFNEYKASFLARKEFEAKSKKWQDNIDTLTVEVQASMKKYEKEMSKMSPKEQQVSRELINVKRKQLMDYQRAIQQNAQQENNKMTQGVIAQINGFLLKYGKDHHYKLILIANSSGTIAYAEDGMDITEKVVAELNEDYANGKK